MPGPGGPTWIEFEEFDTGDPVNDALPMNCFEIIVNDYLASGRVRVGVVGAATATLLDGPTLVAFGIEWLERFFSDRPGKSELEI